MVYDGYDNEDVFATLEEMRAAWPRPHLEEWMLPKPGEFYRVWDIDTEWVESSEPLIYHFPMQFSGKRKWGQDDPEPEYFQRRKRSNAPRKAVRRLNNTLAPRPQVVPAPVFLPVQASRKRGWDQGDSKENNMEQSSHSKAPRMTSRPLSNRMAPQFVASPHPSPSLLGNFFMYDTRAAPHLLRVGSGPRVARHRNVSGGPLPATSQVVTLTLF